MTSRRAWIAGASGVAVAAAAGAKIALRGVSPTRRTGMLAGSRTSLDDVGHKSHSFLLADAHGTVVRRIPLEFQMHGFASDPLAPERAVLFEKKGPGCCEVDIASGERLRTIPTVPGRRFYGHGAFSTDGKLLYCTETVLDGKTGLVAVRDAQTFEVLGELPSFGKEPHDCQLVDGGRTLVVTNGGSPIGEPDPPCVCYVDVGSGRLLEKLPFQTERVNAGHLAVSSSGFLVVVSAPRTGLSPSEPGAITLRPKGGPFRTMKEPADVVHRMRGETLSLAVHEAGGIVAATNPDADLVTIWRLDRMELVTSLDLPGARGIALTQDGSHFVVTWGADANLAFVTTRTLRVDPAQSLSRVGFSGSHLFNWNHDALVRPA